MIDFRVRPARVEDCAALGRIIVEATRGAFQGRVPDRCLEWLTTEESAANWAKNFEPGAALDRGARLFVAESPDATVVGLAMVGPTTPSHAQDPAMVSRYLYDLHSLQVDPAWQRQGVGRLLLSRVAEELRSVGARHLLVRVLRENPNSAFYERLGAVRLGSQPYDWEGYVTEELLYGWDDTGMFGA